jgi:hypothetical protein
MIYFLEVFLTTIVNHIQKEFLLSCLLNFLSLVLSLNNFYFFTCQVVEFIDEVVYLFIGGIFMDDVFVGLCVTFYICDVPA